jgi:hypothetical protein
MVEMSVPVQPNAERLQSPNVALSIAALLLLALMVWRAAESWSNDSHLEHVAGVWIAQAVDLANGTFYRAPYGPYGYGGGRYFPLFFLSACLSDGQLVRVF